MIYKHMIPKRKNQREIMPSHERRIEIHNILTAVLGYTYVNKTAAERLRRKHPSKLGKMRDPLFWGRIRAKECWALLDNKLTEIGK